jgi:predicted transcriptional regulator
MSAKKAAKKLAPREEQIMAVVYRLEKASVAQVLEHLDDAPSYSAVRTMLGLLEKKGYVKRDRSGMTHFYLPTKPRQSAGISALRRVFETFFPQSRGEALAAFIDDSANELTDDEIRQLEKAIRKAKSGDKT